MQACDITFPFNIYTEEINFDVDGVATIMCESELKMVTGSVDCSPNKVCWIIYAYIAM